MLEQQSTSAVIDRCPRCKGSGTTTGGPCRVCLVSRLYAPSSYYTYPPRTPHCCPVCQGKGKVWDGFYGEAVTGSGGLNSPCRSCGGMGVIWG